MGPRKEPKEAIRYPPSKTKAPPFKPHRPSKVIQDSTDESEDSDVGSNIHVGKKAASKASAKVAPRKTAPSVASTSRASFTTAADLINVDEDISNASSDDLPDDPLKAAAKPKPQPKTKGKAPARDQPMPDADEEEAQQFFPDLTGASIPQPFLLRLLHEHFQSKDTQIDKHAIKVLQRYFELFIRESMARSEQILREQAEATGESQSHKWLDNQELEQISSGVLLDF